MKHSEANAVSRNGKKYKPSSRKSTKCGWHRFPIRFKIIATLVHQLYCSPTRLRITICSTLSTADNVEKPLMYKQLPNFKLKKAKKNNYIQIDGSINTNKYKKLI